MKQMKTIPLVVMMALGVAACGQKGPLYQPEDAAQSERDANARAQLEQAQPDLAPVSEASAQIEENAANVEAQVEQVEGEADGVTVEDALGQ